MFKATFASRRPLGIALMATLTFSACGERDPEESFALWSNNEAGWAEIGKYISDKNMFRTQASARSAICRAGLRGTNLLMDFGAPRSNLEDLP